MKKSFARKALYIKGFRKKPPPNEKKVWKLKEKFLIFETSNETNKSNYEKALNPPHTHSG